MSSQLTRRTLLRAPVMISLAGPLTVIAACEASDEANARRFAAVPSYFPHWTTREGHVTQTMLDQFAHETIIGMHHSASLDDLIRILEFPKKGFRIAWYVESNVDETEDDAPTRLPVTQRIGQARARQDMLTNHFGFGAGRFLDMVEIDSGRDKADGKLTGLGNAVEDWLADAQSVHGAGFTYLAKNLRLSQIQQLRAWFGTGFVPRLV